MGSFWQVLRGVVRSQLEIFFRFPSSAPKFTEFLARILLPEMMTLGTALKIWSRDRG